MTRKQYLQKLPLQKRLHAMENIRRNNSFFDFQFRMNKETNIDNVLVFVFSDTKQGHSYWWNIKEKYFAE